MRVFLDPGGWAELVRQLDPVEFWFGSAVLTVLALGGFYSAFRYLHRARLVEDTATSRIRSAAQGYVELFGRGRLMNGESIIAPLSHSPCTWWSFKVEEKVRHGRSSSWEIVKQGVSGALFLLEDETGTCIVDPEHAEVIPSFHAVWYGHSPQAGPPPGGGRRWINWGGRYRYTESRMQPGDPLYAVGWFQTHGTRHGGLETEQAVGVTLREWKRNYAALLERFDADRDGRIDMREWAKARQAARAEVAAADAELATDVNVLKDPPDGRAYLLAALPQEALARRLRRRAVRWLAVFFLGGAAAVFALTARLAA